MGGKFGMHSEYESKIRNSFRDYKRYLLGLDHTSQKCRVLRNGKKRQDYRFEHHLNLKILFNNPVHLARSKDCSLN